MTCGFSTGSPRSTRCAPRSSWASTPSPCGAWARKTARCGRFGTSRAKRTLPKIEERAAGPRRRHRRPGEIIRIQSRPAPGEREITVDHDTHLITDEIFKNLPMPYTVDMYGGTQPTSRHHLRRRPRSRMDAENSRCAEEEGRQGHVLPDRRGGRKIPRRHQAHLRRRPRDRQPHLHPSRHQQHLQALLRGRAEPHRALLRGQARREAGTVPAAVLHRPGARYRRPGAPAGTGAGSGLHHHRRQDRPQRLARQSAASGRRACGRCAGEPAALRARQSALRQHHPAARRRRRSQRDGEGSRPDHRRPAASGDTKSCRSRN